MNALANGPSPSLSESFACSAKKANCSIQSMKDTHTLLSDKKWRPRRHTQLFTNFFLRPQCGQLQTQFLVAKVSYRRTGVTGHEYLLLAR